MYVNCQPVSRWRNVQSVLLLNGKDIHQRIHHKVVQEIGSLPVWQVGVNPAAQLLQFSHQGLLRAQVTAQRQLHNGPPSHEND